MSYKRRFGKANQFRKEGNAKSAIRILRDLVADFPKKAAAYFVIADIFWDAGQLSRASAGFRLAVKHFPKSKVASLGLFHTLWEQSKTDAAFDEIKRFQTISFCQDYADIVAEILLKTKKTRSSTTTVPERRPKTIRICYRTGNDLDLDQVIELYRASTLGERRPVGERERMAAMLQNANLVITAWEGEMMVGISRSITDFAYATYLSDLAVRESHQRGGIGKELMRRTQAAAPQATVILLSAPKAVDYYPHAGFTQHPSAWVLKPGEEIK